MGTFLRNAISKLYNAVSAPVAATRDPLSERLQSVQKTASLLYKRMMKNMGYGRERLQDIVKKETEEEQQQEGKVSAAAKEQREDDDEQYDTAAKIKFVYEGKHLKEIRVNGNLNAPDTKMIMASITPHMRWGQRKFIHLNQRFVRVVVWSRGNIRH